MSRPKRRSRAGSFTLKGNASRKRTRVANQKKKETVDSPNASEKMFRLQQLASQLQFQELSERQQMALEFLQFQDENELTERDLRFIYSYVYPPEECDDTEQEDSYDQFEENKCLIPDVDFNEPNDEPIDEAIDLDDNFEQYNIVFKDFSENFDDTYATKLYDSYLKLNTDNNNSEYDNPLKRKSARLIPIYLCGNNVNSNEEIFDEEENKENHCTLTDQGVGVWRENCLEPSTEHRNMILGTGSSERLKLNRALPQNGFSCVLSHNFGEPVLQAEETANDQDVSYHPDGDDEQLRKKKESQRRYLARLKEKDLEAFRQRKAESQKRYLEQKRKSAKRKR